MRFTTPQVCALATIILDRRVRYEELALGMFLNGKYPELDFELLTGPRKQAAKEADGVTLYGARWSTVEVEYAVWRGRVLATLPDEKLEDVVFMLELRPAADAVADAIIFLEDACSKLEAQHRLLEQRRQLVRDAHSDAPETPAARAEAGGAASASATPPTAETFSETEPPTRPVQRSGPPVRSGRGGTAPRFSGLLLAQPNSDTRAR